MSPKELSTKKKNNSGQGEQDSPKSTAREYFESICVAVILALFIRTFVFQAFKIPTGSMEMNLLIGDHLIVNKMRYSPTASSMEQAVVPIRDVQRGDVIVFKYPDEPERDFIKRVIGLPLERIRLENKTVYINDEPIEEPYVHFRNPTIENSGFFDNRSDNMPELQIPVGHYFVMGDNRDNSHDSRFWGTLSRDMLKGRALMVYWSYASSGEDYQETGLIKRAQKIGEVFLYFISRTRWNRFFHLVR